MQEEKSSTSQLAFQPNCFDQDNFALEEGQPSSVVTNIKVHFATPKGSHLQIPPLTSYKSYHNFEVFCYWWSPTKSSEYCHPNQSNKKKLKKVAFSYFRSCGIVNVSGIPNFEALPEVVNLFNQLLNESLDTQDVVIDNSTAVGNVKDWAVAYREASVHHFLNLRKLKAFLEPPSQKGRGRKTTHPTFTLRPHFFPGGVLRLPGFRGCIILFTSGKFIVVGSKSPCQILQFENKLSAFIKKFTGC